MRERLIAGTAERVFKPADIIEWDNHAFKGETRYSLVEIDDREAVHAQCTDDTASGLFLREEIDLEATPIIFLFPRGVEIKKALQ
ncbi:hypothetical protein J2T57_003660 [Natronocella acetinitrilica]|uniref:Uncharacterized protein n=1 Tax=Natronocella acetinitrilica TaxID=414046 RepID=A0AAE3G7I8_9GAMM|nr:DUF3047 domain-containing protein [Natronocella acetinitrilica]MCP1676499.1 hypothetical protein [Natronocella acetinitrilica]